MSERRTAAAGPQGAGSSRHPDRAAQFMPFAALPGFYDLIREEAAKAERAGTASAGLARPSCIPSVVFGGTTKYRRDVGSKNRR